MTFTLSHPQMYQIYAAEAKRNLIQHAVFHETFVEKVCYTTMIPSQSFLDSKKKIPFKWNSILKTNTNPTSIFQC